MIGFGLDSPLDSMVLGEFAQPGVGWQELITKRQEWVFLLEGAFATLSADYPMLIDSHHHFWHYTAAEFDWISEPMAAIRKDFGRAELLSEMLTAGVSGAVSVQARQTISETRFLLETCENAPELLGVVGWVPLVSEDVGAVIDEFRAGPSGGKLKGVRHVVQGEVDPDFMDGAAFNRGLREVTRCGLVYDLLIHRGQLDAAVRFVDRHPEQRFVLDHIAKPVVNGAPDPVWTSQIRELAQRENVSVKWSGVMTEVPGWRASLDTLRPYFDVVLNAFGPERLMWGSDWPVCTVAIPYAEWVQRVIELTSRLSVEERGLVLGKTAARVYDLA